MQRHEIHLQGVGPLSNPRQKSYSNHHEVELPLRHRYPTRSYKPDGLEDLYIQALLRIHDVAITAIKS